MDADLDHEVELDNVGAFLTARSGHVVCWQALGLAAVSHWAGDVPNRRLASGR